MHPRLALTTSMLAVLGICTLVWLSPTASSALAATSPATLSLQGGGHSNYGLHSLRGKYGFTYSGTTQGAGPVASSGRIDFDGLGQLSAVFTTSVNGTAFTGTFMGSYTVQDNGTGSVLVNLPWLGLQARGNFVIVDHGDGTYFTSTDMGYSVTGTTKKM